MEENKSIPVSKRPASGKVAFTAKFVNVLKALCFWSIPIFFLAMVTDGFWDDELITACCILMVVAFISGLVLIAIKNLILGFEQVVRTAEKIEAKIDASNNE